MALRRYQKNLIRLGVIVILALLAVVCVTLFRPVSSRWLGQKIAQQIEHLTGLDVTFREAVFFLAQQRCVIKELVLHSRDTDRREVLTARKVDISFSLPSILFRQEKILQSVAIEHPSAFPLVIGEGNIRLGDDLDFLYRLLEPAEREMGKPHFILKHFCVRNASVLLKSSLRPSRKPQVLADNMTMRFLLMPSGSRVMTLNGSIPLLNKAEVRVSYTIAPHEPQASFVLELTKAAAAIPLRNTSHLSMASDHLTINGILSQDNTHAKIAAFGKIRKPLVALGTQKPLYSDEHLDFSFRAAYDASAAELMLEKSHLLSNGLEVYTSGSLTLASPFPFSISTRTERVPASLLEHFKTLFPYLDSMIDISDARLRLGASLKGQLADDTLPDFRGWADVLGIRVWYPGIQEPLRQLQGTLEFENSRLAFTHMRGKIGQGDVTLNGQLTGKQVFWEPDALKISWVASLRGEDVLAALSAQRLSPLMEYQVVGNVSGEGTIEKIFPPVHGLPSASMHLSGVLNLADVTVTHPALPVPVQHVQGKLEFQNACLGFTDIRGKISQGDVTIAGQLIGKQVFWQPDVLELNWQASFRVEDILAAVSAQQFDPLKQTEATGEINGYGTLRKLFPSSPIPPSASIKASGVVELADVAVSHPLLPAPIQKIHGRMNVENNRIQFSNLEGSMGECTLLSSGSVVGKDLFWLDPQLDAHVVMTTTASTLLTMMKQFVPGQQVQATVSGKAIVDARIKAPLYTLNRFSIHAKAEFKECYVELDKPIVRAWLKTLEGAVEVRDGTAMLTYISGQVGDVPFNLSGWVKPEAARLVLSSETELDNVKSLLPAVFDKFRVGGSAVLSAEIDVSAKPNQPINYRLSGEILTHDVTFAYIDMPVDVTHINGAFSFHENELRILNVRCWSGRSKDCAVNGFIRFAQKQTVIDFNLRSPLIYLDEWMRDWPKRKDIISSEALQMVSETSPTLEIFGSIDAEKAYYGPVQGDKFHGSFHYQSFPFAPNTFYYDNIQVSAYQGNLTGSGSILFPKGDNIYEAKVEAGQINVNKLLEALREKKQTIVGRLSGTVSVVGEGKDVNKILGSGKFTVQDSRFIDAVIFKALGGILRSPMFNDISFTQVMGDFTLKNGAIHFSKFDLRNPMLQMQATGKIGFNKQVDLDLHLAFLSAYLGLNIPIVKNIMAVMEKLGSKIFKFRIVGTLDEPRVIAVPLSIDEVSKIVFPANAR